MGYTGHATHINIRVETINRWGPTMYDWDGVITQGLGNLGFRFKTVGYSGYHIDVPDVLDEAIELIRESIQRGVPLIMWEPLSPDFGIIYGFNDENQILYVIDATSEGEIPFDRIGRGEHTPEFYVIAINEIIENSVQERIIGTLDLIVKYGLEDAHDFWEFTTGLPAYDAWMKAFQNKTVDAPGSAFNIQVLMHARNSAIRFLSNFKSEFNDNQQIDLVEKSMNSFTIVVDLYQKLEELFPYPHGGNPNDSLTGKEAIQILREIKNAEETALLTLKRLREHYT